jgi:hypothetical protein
MNPQAIKTSAMAPSYHGIPAWTDIPILYPQDTAWSSVNRADQWGSFTEDHALVRITFFTITQVYIRS